MATLKLTDGEVEDAAAGPKDVYLWDTSLRRFGLRVTPAGTKIYLVQYRPKGQASKTRRIRIGEHDGELWNVTKARARARKLLGDVDAHRDPFAEQQRQVADEIAQAEAAAEATRAALQRQHDAFGAVAERYIDAALSANRSGAETARLLRHDPIPAWRDRHVAEIRRADVAELLDAIKRRSPAVARSTYAALRGLYGWCLERDLVDASPCDRITAPPRPDARDRVLADDELRLIWRAADGLGFPFGPAIQLLMLTGQRRGEVGGMAWAELDLDSATWRIPKERTKNAKAHEIDLSPEALAILKALKHTGQLVFPGRKAPKRKGDEDASPASAAGGLRGFSASKRRLDELVDAERRKVDPESKPIAPWRVHDLRRTAATGMAGMGFPPHVVERVLNHVSGATSGLVGVYQRHEYRPERKAAVTAWGAHVAAVIAAVPRPSNVRDLRPSQAR